jgi:hypothetical protein
LARALQLLLYGLALSADFGLKRAVAMLKRFLTGAVFALAAAGFAATALASTHTIGFEDKHAFGCSQPGQTQHDGGLSFGQDFYACYYSPNQPADFPIVPPSKVMASGGTQTIVSEDDGTVFDLIALDLAAGPFTTPGDTTFVTGFFHNGGTITTTLTLNTPFTTYNLGWAGLDSVTFSGPQQSQQYVGFDNIVFNGNGFDTTRGVPEPAEWALMLGGLLASGYMLRRARQLAAVEA